MSGSNVGLAFGTMAETIGKAITAKKQQEHKEEIDRQQMISDLVSSSLKSGNLKNPNETFSFLLQNMQGKGGGKGGKKFELPGPLKTIIGATQQAAGGSAKTLGGQDKPSFAPNPSAAGPQFYTNQELQQQNDDAQINLEKRRQKEITQPEKSFESGLRTNEIRARLGNVDKDTQKRAQQMAAAAGDPEGWESFIQDAAKQIASERKTTDDRKAALAKYPAPMRERIAELVAKGIPEDRAPAVAAQEMERERGQRQQQATTRLQASLAMSRASLAASTERLSEMKQLFPLTIAAKQAGVEVAQLRPEVVKNQIAKGSAVKPDLAAAKEAAKIVQTATRLAASKAAKQTWLAEGLGIDDDEATIRKNLIGELSGGQDPAAVEELARHASATPTATPAARPAAAASANPFR